MWLTGDVIKPLNFIKLAFKRPDKVNLVSILLIINNSFSQIKYNKKLKLNYNDEFNSYDLSINVVIFLPIVIIK